MYKNDSFMLREDYVRLARQIISMKSEPITATMEQRSNNDFWLRIFAPDPRHIPASFFFCQDIHIIYEFSFIISYTTLASCRASRGGTALPT